MLDPDLRVVGVGHLVDVVVHLDRFGLGPRAEVRVGVDHPWGHPLAARIDGRSEEHTSELQSLMRISYAVFCLKKKKNSTNLLHNIIGTSLYAYILKAHCDNIITTETEQE